jgi:hypothetical protein
MHETKEIRVRMTEEQYSVIKTRSQIQGYNTVSAFLRDKILRIPYKTEQRLLEIYKALVRREP